MRHDVPNLDNLIFQISKLYVEFNLVGSKAHRLLCGVPKVLIKSIRIIKFRKHTVQNLKEKTNFIKSACSTFLKAKSLKSFSLMNPSI